MIASSRYAADDLVRSSCDSALLGVNRYTFEELVYVLSSHRMNSLGLSPISGISQDALAAAVARRVSLGVLREAASFPGFGGSLSRTLRDLRLARVRPERLVESERTAADLAVLLEQYEAELKSRGLADFPMRVELAIEESRAMEPAALVLLDVRVKSTAEEELLKTLAARAPSTLLLPVEESLEDPKSCLGAVRRFALSKVSAPQRAGDSSFAFLSASSESLECVEIARQILHGQIPFDETAVLLRNPHRQGPLIREALERAGIPASYSRGSQKADLAGRAFLILLRCRAERFSVKRFAEYLSLGQSPRPASARWERLLREAAVISGADRWKIRLTAAAERLSAKGKDAAGDLEALGSLMEFAIPIIQMLASLPERATWRDWLAKLDLLAERALANPRSVLELLDELAPLGDLGPVTAAEVTHTLERSLLSFRELETGSRYGRVFVAPIDEARGMQFRAVFVPGLNEGMFPRPVREDPLLLDEQRKLLGMATSEDDGELLQIAIACATERIAFSCARLDLATGRVRVPSFFAAEVLTAAYGSGGDITKLLEAAKSASETRIGWSAPSRAFDSIDDAEYDLAAFRYAVAAKTPGGYAWIGELNRHPVRAIQARIQRWSKEWSSADGLSDTDVNVSAILKKATLKERAYSVSALQQFARCPYRFFLSEIVRLSLVEEPDVLERMDAVLRGSLYHKVLFHLFSEGQEQQVDEILQNLANVLAEEHAPPVRGVWDVDVEKLRMDLRGWLAIRDPDWKPTHVELSFGIADIKEHDLASTSDCVVIAGGYRLIGSIDLVERNSGGSIRVTDHKTGRFPFQLKNCVIGGGEVLQPVLYALAVETLLGETPGQSQLSYATLRGAYQNIPVLINAESRGRAMQVLAVADEWIDKAFLPAAPKREGCKKCPYLPVCGPYEELRVTEKSQAELRSLNDIRRLT